MGSGPLRLVRCRKVRGNVQAAVAAEFASRFQEFASVVALQSALTRNSESLGISTDRTLGALLLLTSIGRPRVDQIGRRVRRSASRRVVLWGSARPKLPVARLGVTE